jgi:chromosome partitioning protein
MMKIINEETIEPDYGILHHREGIDLIPANIELSGLEVLLANVMSRENILKEYLDQIKDRYEYIIIDCMPSLGMMTINALVAATTVLIPVPAAYLPVKGLQQLIKTISMVRKRLNKRLAIEGILLTMVDYRTNYARDISEKLREGYGATIGMFETYIPFSVKAAECSSEGVSIFVHEPKGKVADAYQRLTEEVLSHEK